MSNANFFAVLEQRGVVEDRLLLITASGVHYTYGDMQRESARVANALRNLGLVPGDRVSVQVEKSVANLWLYLGVLRAGLVFHPLNPGYAFEEMRYFLGNAEPGLLICDPENAQAYRALCDEAGIKNLMTMDAQGQGNLADYIEPFACDFTTEQCADDDLAVLLYSSGTTGRPKGIMLSHKNLRSNAEVLVDTWGFTASDVLVHALPIYHVHGLFVGVHCVLMSGASMHWLAQFGVQSVCDRLKSSTVMMGVPTYYTRLLADSQLSRDHCQTMRLFVSGSAPLLEETFVAFEARTGHAILERYGMSETGMNCSNPLVGERRPGTVGLPLRGTEIRVCDEQHNPCPTGEIGELQVRGLNVFKGYWRMPEKTASDFTDDGWFITGDQGLIDELGYISIVGRSKDMVITGGLNVYPKEVEVALNDIPGIIESAVFGVPHPDFGETVVAAVVVDPQSDITSESIRADLVNQLAKFKLPKKIQRVEALPRNSMGKVQKNVLREQWCEPFE